jgi:hypothetical protein
MQHDQLVEKHDVFNRLTRDKPFVSSGVNGRGPDEKSQTLGFADYRC